MWSWQFIFKKVLLGLSIASLGMAASRAVIESNQRIAKGALNQTRQTFFYDPSYVKLDYPGGDVSLERGVCSDVVIRALRYTGVDLQQLVHEDMKRSFRAYPNRWGLNRPDPNIDHRRVPNLMTFFQRHGKTLPITSEPTDYQPGDIVVWQLDNGLLHLGIVSDQQKFPTLRPLIIHNIGAGARVEDVLFEFKIIGHYRYFMQDKQEMTKAK